MRCAIGVRKKEEGRRKKEEARRKKQEGRRKKQEGRRKKQGREQLVSRMGRALRETHLWRRICLRA
ncbi:hypothetical protein [Kamptonema sp. UHCC 0994]|uniref:hypothetical protein n=1 Tax=Kamptonema sp. UHCC 0994 TaxID=3031329 RepID=UPI0023BA5B9D|nr:hypothetical protein [Kamptonema sp. UHCC 0994]MDF0556632.1 hypothetical protein [Kamptonema sp. UHCC 0994]